MAVTNQYGQTIDKLTVASVHAQMLHVGKLSKIMDNATPGKDKLVDKITEKLNKSPFARGIVATQKAGEKQKAAQKSAQESLDSIDKTLKDMMRGGRGPGGGGRGPGGGPPPPPDGGGGARGKISSLEKDTNDAVKAGSEKGLTGFLKRAGSIFAAYRLGDQLWGGVIEENAKYMVAMRQTLYTTKGITKEAHGLQKAWEDVDDIVDAEGHAIMRSEEAYREKVKLSQRGLKLDKEMTKDIQKQNKLLRTAGVTAFAINADVGETADLFADWAQYLGLSDRQLHGVGSSMKDIARQSGLSGQHMIQVARSSEAFMKSMRDAGTLTARSADAIMRMQAQFKRMGVEEIGSKFTQALTSMHDLFNTADPKMRQLLMMGAARQGMQEQLVQSPEGFLNDPKMRKQLLGGMEDAALEIAQRYAPAVKSLKDISKLDPKVINQINMAFQDLFGAKAGALNRFFRAQEEANKSYVERIVELANKAEAVRGKDAELEATYKKEMDDATRHEREQITTAFMEALHSADNLDEAMDQFKKVTKTYSDSLDKMKIDTRDASKVFEDVMTKQIGDLEKQYNALGKAMPAGLETDKVKQAMEEYRKHMQAGDKEKAMALLEGLQDRIRKAQDTIGVKDKAQADPITDMQKMLDAQHNELMKLGKDAIDRITHLLGGQGLLVGYLSMLALTLLPQILNILKVMGIGNVLGGAGNVLGGAGRALGGMGSSMKTLGVGGTVMSAGAGLATSELWHQFAGPAVEKWLNTYDRPDREMGSGTDINTMDWGTFASGFGEIASGAAGGAAMGSKYAGPVGALAGGAIGALAAGIKAVIRESINLADAFKKMAEEDERRLKINKELADVTQKHANKEAQRLSGSPVQLEETITSLKTQLTDLGDRYDKASGVNKAELGSAYDNTLRQLETLQKERDKLIEQAGGESKYRELLNIKVKESIEALGKFNLTLADAKKMTFKTGENMPDLNWRNVQSALTVVQEAAKNPNWVNEGDAFVQANRKRALKENENTLKAAQAEIKKQTGKDATLEELEKMAEAATKKHSIYTHDVTLEKLLEEGMPSPDLFGPGKMVTLPALANGTGTVRDLMARYGEVFEKGVGGITPAGTPADIQDRLRQERATRTGPTETHSAAEDETAKNTETTNQKLDKLLMLLTSVFNSGGGTFAPPNGKMIQGNTKGMSIFGLPTPNWMNDWAGTFMDRPVAQTTRDGKPR